MKVLMINTVPMEKNGITNVICNLVTNVNNENIQIDCVAINDVDLSYKNIFKKHGGKIFVIPQRLSKPIAYIKKLVSIIKKNKYDCIHAHGNSHTLALELFAAKIAGCGFRIAHSHSTSCKYKAINKLLTPLFWLCCTGRIACSAESGKWMFGKRKFLIINNGINTTKFKFDLNKRLNIKNIYSINEDLIVVGHVGEFNNVKNQSFLVSVFSEILKKKNAVLMMVGKGNQEKAVVEKAESLGIKDNVIFVGAVDNVSDYLSAFDVIIMPSFFEGFPLTLVEEQASGLSCFVSDCITKETNLTGNVHFLSLKTSESDWASAVLEGIYEGNRSAISERSIELIAKRGYSIQNEICKLENYYIKNFKSIK